MLLRHILKLIRPQNGLIIALSFATGWLWFAAPAPGLWIGMALVYLLHSAGTIRNDVVDQEADRLNMPDRPLVSQGLSLLSAEAFFWGFMLLAITLSLFGGKAFFVWGLLIYVVGWLYNEPPYLASHRPLMSIILLILYFTLLPLLFGAWVSSGQLPFNNLPTLLVFTGLSLSRGATSIFKDYKDVVGDQATGKITFLLRYGSRVTSLTGLIFSSIGGLFILFGTGLVKGFSLVMLPTVLFICLGIWHRFTVVQKPKVAIRGFGLIYSNEIRLQLAHLFWLICPYF